MKRINLIGTIILIALIICGCAYQIKAQNLFYEECFSGGVTAAGRTSQTTIDGYFKIHWNETFELKKAYALLYRYDNPVQKRLILNSSNFALNASSQYGEELPDNPNSVDVFAVHIIDITEDISLENDSIYVYLDGADAEASNLAQGWWSVMCVFLYEAENLNEKTCLRIYTASQRQDEPQDYNIPTPNYDDSKDIGFSIYSDRINDFEIDRSIIGINGQLLGNIGGADATNPGSAPGSAGVRGHFYYENGELFGLDDDMPNATVEDTDGIAVINDYLINDPTQEIYFSPVNPDPDDRFNVHPAFFLTYTPDCNFLPDLSDMPRSYSLCRGESIALEAAEGYDNYSWSTSLGNSTGLNDSTLANPICSADTSLWYTVRMWNDDEEGCSQTIPVFVEVNTVPVPQNIEITPSVCPPATGGIEVINPAGPGSFTYSIDGVVQLSPVFDELAAGSYDIAVNSAQGCVWDSTITVPLNPTQEADFTPNPSSGFSPLEVFFDNRSTGASDYLWLIDGEEISSSENLLYTFPDSGSFEISLIAFLNEESCADTATFTLRVDQGIEIMLPNIVTPNGDGRNDKLVALLKGVETCQWVVYNRWGVEMYAGASPKLSGLSNLQTVNDSGFAELQLWEPQAEIPDGVYTVVFQAQGIKGQSEEMVFSLTVGR